MLAEPNMSVKALLGLPLRVERVVGIEEFGVSLLASALETVETIWVSLSPCTSSPPFRKAWISSASDSCFFINFEGFVFGVASGC